MVRMYSLQDDPECVNDMFCSHLYYLRGSYLLTNIYWNKVLGLVRYSEKKKEYLYFCRTCNCEFHIDKLVEENKISPTVFRYICGFCGSFIFYVSGVKR